MFENTKLENPLNLTCRNQPFVFFKNLHSFYGIVDYTNMNTQNTLKYRISSNEQPRRLFNFKSLSCDAYLSAYFKVREIIHMNFQNLVIFSF